MHLAQHVDFLQHVGPTFLQCFSYCFHLGYPTFLEVIFFLTGPPLTPWNELPALSPLAPPSAAYSLKRVAGICPLELWRDGDSFVVHFPVEGTSHGIPGLCLIPKVIVVNDIDHGAHDGFVV